MIYSAAKAISRIILSTMRRCYVQGRENFPTNGGFLVVSNHSSYWDPVAVGCAIKQRIHYMAKEELFKIPIFRKLILSLEAFPVRRDTSDRQAIRTALNLLKEGRVVGLFPEGTRSHSGELLKLHLGAAMLALKAKVPVVPVAVLGTKGFCGKIRVKVGKPLYFEELMSVKISKQNIEEATELIMYEINSLMEEK